MASELSDINEPIKPEPKAEAIVDVDVKKESREASQSAGTKVAPVRALPTRDTVSEQWRYFTPRLRVAPGRALPTPDTVRHGDSGESEGSWAYNLLGLTIVLLILLGLWFSTLNSLNNVKSDRVLTSSKMEGNSREKGADRGNSSMGLPMGGSSDSTVLNKELSQKNSSSQNSQGSVVLPKAEGKFSPKKNESQALAGSGRTEERLLFSGKGTGRARLVCVDSGAVVLSNGKRYSITQLSASDFSHLMRSYDARSIGFEMPLRFIDPERTWWDNSLAHSRKAKLFAQSGNVIILFSKDKGYHYVEYSKLSARDRQYVDSIDFSLPLKHDPFGDFTVDPFAPEPPNSDPFAADPREDDPFK